MPNNLYCILLQAHLSRGWKQPGAEMLRSLRVPKQMYREEKPPPAKVCGQVTKVTTCVGSVPQRESSEEQRWNLSLLTLRSVILCWPLF